jgi:hypothetical protein
LEHILKYICMRVHEEIERSGKVQWDPNKIQQWWDRSGRHSDVYMKCGEKMDAVERSIGVPLKSNSKWDQSGRWSLLSKCSDLWHVQFHWIEFGWNHVVVSTMIYCSARRHDIGWNLVQMSTWSNEEASILYFVQRWSPNFHLFTFGLKVQVSKKCLGLQCMMMFDRVWFLQLRINICIQ